MIVKFFDDAANQKHPLRILNEFLSQEEAYETSKQYEKMRFVGYILEIGYDVITIITSDPFKIAVGGIPRNSLLIITPSNANGLPPHFTLLRVLESAPTPLSKEVQQTYFELQKRSMPELDIFTQSELQWGALKTEILGMYYPNPDPKEKNKVEFSGDINNFVSAHKYKVYAPDQGLLNLIINSLVPDEDKFNIGHLRLTENRLRLPNSQQEQVPVFVSTRDFMGARTAMFGKTRLGKSNIVKLIAQSLIETTEESQNVGQLIFDINGEYANDNPQDDNRSLASVYKERCIIYALIQKPSTFSRPLKLNFYEQPDATQQILSNFLHQEGRSSSNYVRSYTSVELPNMQFTNSMIAGSERNRAVRKILIFWAILKKADFTADEERLRNLLPPKGPNAPGNFSPHFSIDNRKLVYGENPPAHPRNLQELVRELEEFARFDRDNKGKLTTSSNDLFDADDKALLELLEPQPGRSGTTIIQPYKQYHDRRAGDFVKEILEFLDAGKTIILDLGNAHPDLLTYFSDLLSNVVFRHQVDKFSNNKLGNHFIQLYFEEAHNLFPRNRDPKDTYSRFAKEGAKYHIGMVYSTQSPTTIYSDLLAQTENFFIAHMASQDEVNALARVNVAYQSLSGDILRAKTKGYVRMLTQSHRFVVSVQANRFSPLASS